MPTLWDSIKEKLGVAIVTAVVSVATIFSDHIVGRIKQKVNVAEQRPAQHEKIAKDISSFVFAAENLTEFAKSNLLQTEKLIREAVDPYNTAIDAIRKNEYVYHAVVARYWDPTTTSLYSSLINDIRSVDAAIHRLNELYAPLLKGEKAIPDSESLKKVASAAGPEITKLQASAKMLLLEMSKLR